MSTRLPNVTHDLRIVVLGESGVGKTSLTDRFVFDKHMVRYDPFTPSPDSRSRRTLGVDGEIWTLNIEDLSITPLRRKEPGFLAHVFECSLREADGVVLLYDVTDKKSYEHVTQEGHRYVWGSRAAQFEPGLRYPTGKQRVGCVLVGNKSDLVTGENGSERREVMSSLADEWARMLGLRFFETDSWDKGRLEDVMRALVRNIEKARRRDAEDVEMVKSKESSTQSNAEASKHRSRNRDEDEGAIRDNSKKGSIFPRLGRLRDALPGIRLKFKAPT